MRTQKQIEIKYKELKEELEKATDSIDKEEMAKGLLILAWVLDKNEESNRERTKSN